MNIAPDAPGSLGTQPEPQALLTYLTDLSSWLSARRAELDELDAAVQASDHAAELTADIRLGLTLWQAIKTRYDLMMKTWDSGRVGPVERETLSQQIFGRLETPGVTGTGLQGTNVVEACKLSDALTAQLRQRLQLDPSGSAALTRVRDLRASLERLRDQVALEPAATAGAARAKLGALATRVEKVAEKAARGGDVGGLLGPLENDAATFERDLIVGGVERRANAGRVAELQQRRAVLASRQSAVSELVAKAALAVSPAPKYAVPDVERLGPVPSSGAELDAYAGRLDQVVAALDFVEKANTDALALPAQLKAQVDAVAARASNDATLTSMIASARELLGQTPVPVDAVRPIVAGCDAYLASKG